MMKKSYELYAYTASDDIVRVAASHELKICLTIMYQLLISQKGYTGFTIIDNDDSIIISVTDYRL